MGNERIKEEAKVTPEAVAEVLQEVAASISSEVKQLMYVGPSLPGLTKYTIVESLEVAHVKALIKERKVLEKLFVSIGKIAEFEKRVKEKGTLEYRYYHQAMQPIENKEAQ